MRQIEIARHGGRHRSGVDLVIRKGLETVALETKGRCRYVPLTNYHGCDGPDLHPDLGMLVEALERRKRAGGWHGQRDARAIVRFRDPQVSFALRLAVGDHIEKNVTASATHLVLGNDPIKPQGDAELPRQCLSQFNLKSGRIPGFAREWKRVRVST